MPSQEQPIWVGCSPPGGATLHAGAVEGSPGGRLGRAGAVLQAGVPVHPDKHKGEELDDLDVEARDLGHQGAPPQVVHCSQHSRRDQPCSTLSGQSRLCLDTFKPLPPSGASSMALGL